MLSSAQCLEADSEHNSRERKHKNKVREKKEGREGKAGQVKEGISCVRVRSWQWILQLISGPGLL